MSVIVRELKRKTLSLSHRIAYTMTKKRLCAQINNFDASEVNNNDYSEWKENGAPKSITFILTRFVRFHGGQTSVLRLGTKLSEMGVEVKYCLYKPQTIKDAKTCALSNLFSFKGEIVNINDYLEDIAKGKEKSPDVICATSWDTVSYTKRFESYKAYFVQDYEPYFYEFGERFLMAKSTYEQGLHMISLGEWNREMIEKNCRVISPVDVVSFPYEKKEYPTMTKDFDGYRDKKKITIAVYLKYYGKRLPNLIPRMLVNTKRELLKKGIELEILYFGEAKSFKAEGGKNLGMLTKKELLELYRKADFGMVASMTNISLVPYEMHSAGLPVIEFRDGTYTYFFKKETALLTSIAETDISSLLVKAMENPDGLRTMTALALEEMKELSWDRTAKEFLDALKKKHEKKEIINRLIELVGKK